MSGKLLDTQCVETGRTIPLPSLLQAFPCSARIRGKHGVSSPQYRNLSSLRGSEPQPCDAYDACLCVFWRFFVLDVAWFLVFEICCLFIKIRRHLTCLPVLTSIVSMRPIAHQRAFPFPEWPLNPALSALPDHKGSVRFLPPDVPA